jgi:hypothetical protein
MPNFNRDLLTLFGALAVAACLLAGSVMIYPGGRQMEVGLSAESQSIKGMGASAFPEVNLFSIPPEYSRDAKVHVAEHIRAENDTDERQAPPVGGQFGRGFPQFQVDLRTVLADLGRPHSVTPTMLRRSE